MPRRGQLTHVEIAERLTVLETNWPHLERGVGSLAQKVAGVEKQLMTAVYYVKVAATLGASVVLHVSGGSSADAVLGWLQLLKELFV